MKSFVFPCSAAALLVIFCSCAPRELPPASGKVAATAGNEHMMLATLWQQTSAEADALYYQSYAAATAALTHRLARHRGGKPPAIITDIDETVLDNSPYQARVIRHGWTFPEGWREWVEEARAEPLPGAVEFLRHADREGVRIFYVSNRHAGEEEATLENFRRHGIPQAQRSQLLLMREDPGKAARIARVRRDHEVLLLIGDQLGDFGKTFERLSVRDRARAVERNRHQFGSRFIMLPNPMYGSFEQAVLGHRMLSPAEQRQARSKALRR